MASQPVILFIAGFGDTGAMFAGLQETPLADQYNLRPMNLPGFGAPALEEETTLEALGAFVADRARKEEAEIIVAHSVASIIASLAAGMPDCPIKTILSLEGNLTAEDAYFSGTAAAFDDPATFQAEFLKRLDEMAAKVPIIGRYRESVMQADPTALWELGKDAHRFSETTVPGEALSTAARAIYFYNPDNCPAGSLKWLEESRMERVLLANTSHWASVDQPALLAEKILQVL